MTVKDWEKKVEDFVGEIAGDDSLSDREYLEVLEELTWRAESAIDAKRCEMDGEEESD